MLSAGELLRVASFHLSDHEHTMGIQNVIDRIDDDNQLTMSRRSRDTLEISFLNVLPMQNAIVRTPFARLVSLPLIIVCALAIFSAAKHGTAQDTPLLSGGVGFFTSTRGGKTTYQPHIEPLAAAPIGSHFLVDRGQSFWKAFLAGQMGRKATTTSMSPNSSISRATTWHPHTLRLLAEVFFCRLKRTMTASRPSGSGIFRTGLLSPALVRWAQVQA